MKRLGFIAAVLLVAALIVSGVLMPVAQPEATQISLPVSRMLACPVGDASMGTTTVSVTDQENFTAGELNALPSQPELSFSAEDPSKAVIVRGSATVGGVSVYAEGDKSMTIPCSTPVTSGTWNGVSTAGSASTLVFTNVDSGSAVVDVFLYGTTGPISPPGLRDIPVPSGTTRMLVIDTDLAPSEAPVSVQIRASKGRVAALLRVIGADGYDWQLPQTTADTDLVMAGVPAGEGTRTLSMTNTDPTTKAVVSVQVLADTGSFAPLGFETIEVPPARAISVDITQALGGQASGVHLVSDRPITATMNITGPDVAGISGEAPLNGAVVLPGIGGTLWAANPGSELTMLTLRSDDGNGTVQTTEIPVGPESIASIDFPASGTARVSTTSAVLRVSLVLTGTSWSILPIWGGGLTTSMDAPALAPGLG